MAKELEIVEKKLEKLENTIVDRLGRLDETIKRMEWMTKRMRELGIDLSGCPYPYVECFLKNVSSKLRWVPANYVVKVEELYLAGEHYCDNCPYVSLLTKKPLFLNPSRE